MLGIAAVAEHQNRARTEYVTGKTSQCDNWGVLKTPTEGHPSVPPFEGYLPENLGTTQRLSEGQCSLLNASACQPPGAPWSSCNVGFADRTAPTLSAATSSLDLLLELLQPVGVAAISGNLIWTDT